MRAFIVNIKFHSVNGVTFSDQKLMFPSTYIYNLAHDNFCRRWYFEKSLSIFSARFYISPTGPVIEKIHSQQSLAQFYISFEKAFNLFSYNGTYPIFFEVSICSEFEMMMKIRRYELAYLSVVLG